MQNNNLLVNKHNLLKKLEKETLFYFTVAKLEKNLTLKYDT